MASTRGKDKEVKIVNTVLQKIREDNYVTICNIPKLAKETEVSEKKLISVLEWYHLMVHNQKASKVRGMIILAVPRRTKLHAEMVARDKKEWEDFIYLELQEYKEDICIARVKENKTKPITKYPRLTNKILERISQQVTQQIWEEYGNK